MSILSDPDLKTPTPDWPDHLRGDFAPDVAEAPQALPAKRARFSLSAEFRKRPLLYISLGALIVGGVAAIIGRKAIYRAAATGAMRAARRRPLTAARMAARHPRAAARIAAVGLEPVIASGLRAAKNVPGAMRDAADTVREKLPAHLRRSTTA